MSMLGPFPSAPVRPATQQYPTPIPFAHDTPSRTGVSLPPDSPLITTVQFALMYLVPVGQAAYNLLQSILTYGPGAYQTEQAVVALQAAQFAQDAARVALQSYNNLLDQWQQDAQAMGDSWVTLNPPPQPSLFPVILPVVAAWQAANPVVPAPVLTTKLDA